MLLLGIFLTGQMTLAFVEAPVEEPPGGGPVGGSSGPPAPPSLPAIYGSTVYQGVAIVTSGEPGSALMELGNGGKEIASTDKIQLRANSATGAAAVRVEKDAATGRANLHAPGGVCFGAGNCVTAWPTGGSGTTFWHANGGVNIQPETITNGIDFSPTLANYNAGLELTANNTDRALYVSNKIGVSATSAAQFVGGIDITGDLLIDARPSGDELVINKNGVDYPVWHSGNDGHTATGTGPDASLLDGESFEFQRMRGNGLKACGGSAAAGHCFCVNFGGYGVQCVRLQ